MKMGLNVIIQMVTYQKTVDVSARQIMKKMNLDVVCIKVNYE